MKFQSSPFVVSCQCYCVFVVINWFPNVFFDNRSLIAHRVCVFFFLLVVVVGILITIPQGIRIGTKTLANTHG